jgi:hypothetical protein
MEFIARRADEQQMLPSLIERIYVELEHRVVSFLLGQHCIRHRRCLTQTNCQVVFHSAYEYRHRITNYERNVEP